MLRNEYYRWVFQLAGFNCPRGRRGCKEASQGGCDNFGYCCFWLLYVWILIPSQGRPTFPNGLTSEATLPADGQAEAVKVGCGVEVYNFLLISIVSVASSAYFPHADPCGSSSGSGIAASIGLAAVTLGSETNGSITCPASKNNVVGIKPTLGLTSRAGGNWTSFDLSYNIMLISQCSHSTFRAPGYHWTNDALSDRRCHCSVGHCRQGPKRQLHTGAAARGPRLYKGAQQKCVKGQAHRCSSEGVFERQHDGE